ncbi:MAG: electron transfer flavoprotein subunit alpha/FixB family protein [Deltaproteobacteria bacterium]|nr:MAG: electron transfer flavoprotein subunit alpha/FixB family protein [Deltaproteobacteria bacterium]
MSILVFADSANGAFKPTAAELLGKATALAAALGTTVTAAVLGDAPAASLGGLGAAKVFQAAGDFSNYDNGAIVDALAAIVAAANPTVILAPASYIGRDALPRLAARLDTAMGSDCSDLKVEGGVVVGRRSEFAGRAYADVSISSTPAVFTVRPNTFPKPENNGGSAEVVAVDWSASTPTVSVVETLAPEATGIDLSSAGKVVAGGRSLKSKENFDSVIRPLGAALQAGVGASRAATDAGYAPHNEQVGQTGQTVNPQLYIAAGISGAIQHLAGMRTSKVIVAINKDPDAPIFQHATYGIVADLFDVVPELTKAVEALD